WLPMELHLRMVMDRVSAIWTMSLPLQPPMELRLRMGPPDSYSFLGTASSHGYHGTASSHGYGLCLPLQPHMELRLRMGPPDSYSYPWNSS
ncbi:24312_t:CDS:2, partial [Racocetra persica]